MRLEYPRSFPIRPAVAWYARTGHGVHVLTANDYLAGRDAEWMRGVYEWLDLSVAAIHRSRCRDDRRAAYRADITYGTAAEVGFDYLRHGLAHQPSEVVHRPFAAALIDEVDSILIDEARIHDAPDAHLLLTRDVDYLVAGDAVWPVDELKGRIVADRRWPAGLQTALEFKERVRLKQQGRIRERRDAALTGVTPLTTEAERIVTLATIDDLWSDYLAAVRELAGTIWTSLGGRQPLAFFLSEVHKMFAALERTIPEEVAARLAAGDAEAIAAAGRGATWTYFTTDEPFGSMTRRIRRGPIGAGLLLTTNM
jgi:preprotein translocase subunit SecA